jgi:hypothetical protein
MRMLDPFRMFTNEKVIGFNCAAIGLVVGCKPWQ